MKPEAYETVCDAVPEDWLPRLDRPGADTDIPFEQRWIKDGALILPGFMPYQLVEAYCAEREKLPDWADARATGYLDSPTMRDLALHPPLLSLLSSLLGGEVGLTLSLSGWISTEREWHQDGYLNPPEIAGHYIAVWFALGDIHPDCGPFGYVPGSHRWPAMSGEKVRALLTPEEAADPLWPKHADRFTTPMIEAEIAARDAQPQVFLGHKGDVLIWHSRLVHCGMKPNIPGMERRGLIAHYSVIKHRTDMPWWARHEGGGAFACFPGALTVTGREPVEILTREELL